MSTPALIQLRPNVEVERRGQALTQSEGTSSQPSIPPKPTEDAARDRSNRLLEGRVLECPKYRIHSRLVPRTLRLKPMHYIGIKTER